MIGLDVELLEPNFKRFRQQTAQYPCFIRPRPHAGDGALELLRLPLVVPDLEVAYDNLSRIFAPASRSKPYDIRQDGRERSFRIGLGGLEQGRSRPTSRRVTRTSSPDGR